MNLIPLARKPWPEMVAYLKEKMEQAERGELIAIAMISEYHTGESEHRTFHDENSQPIKLIGHLELVVHGLCAREIRRRS